jgi:hypothetical protein
MTTTKRKSERHFRVLDVLPGPELLCEIRDQRPRSAATDHYTVRAVPADFGGRAFRVEKVSDPEGETYFPHLRHQHDGRDRCECLGFERWHNDVRCRHLQLIDWLIANEYFSGGQP